MGLHGNTSEGGGSSLWNTISGYQNSHWMDFLSASDNRQEDWKIEISLLIWEKNFGMKKVHCHLMIDTEYYPNFQELVIKFDAWSGQNFFLVQNNKTFSTDM